MVQECRVNARGSFTPRLELLNGLPQIAAHELRVPIDLVQGARHDVLLCRPAMHTSTDNLSEA